VKFTWEHYGGASQPVPGWALCQGVYAYAWIRDNGVICTRKMHPQSAWEFIEDPAVLALPFEEKKRYLEVLVRMEA
jgi:hypothetical protein